MGGQKGGDIGGIMLDIGIPLLEPAVEDEFGGGCMPGGNINGGIIGALGGNGIRPPNICGLKPGKGIWGAIGAAAGVVFSLLSVGVAFSVSTVSFGESVFSAASPFLESGDLFSPYMK